MEPATCADAIPAVANNSAQTNLVFTGIPLFLYESVLVTRLSEPEHCRKENLDYGLSITVAPGPLAWDNSKITRRSRLSAPAPVVRAITLTEQVAANVHRRILEGALAPGERLVEQTIAREFGVGQNVVREALISLAHRGFVKRITNRGTYVTKLSYEEAQKLAEVREALEKLVCEKIEERQRTEELDLRGLSEALAGMRAAALNNDRQEFYDCDLRFHRALWALAGNEYLEAALEEIVAPLFAFFIVLFTRRNEAQSTLLEAVAAHEQLAERLTSGIGSCAEEIHNLVNLSLEDHRGLISET